MLKQEKIVNLPAIKFLNVQINFFENMGMQCSLNLHYRINKIYQ